MAIKKERFITPVGTLVWPKLSELDVYQPMKNGKPFGAPKIQYTTRIKFSDADHAKIEAFLAAKMEELCADCDSPRLSCFKTDKKTGEVTLQAASGEKYKPVAVDAKNKRLNADIIIGGGSKAKLDLTINAYDGFGGGINLYINAVQILDLVVGGARGAQFEEADGFEASDDEQEPNFKPVASDKPAKSKAMADYGF